MSIEGDNRTHEQKVEESLEEISLSLKILIRYLQEITDENFDQEDLEL